MMRACSEVTAEGTIWPVDAALRPEGKSGPLVRTVASHAGYYQRWAQTWEFQALLKARPVAGDLELGQRLPRRGDADGVGGGAAAGLRHRHPGDATPGGRHLGARRRRPRGQARPGRAARRRVRRAAAATRARPRRPDAAQPVDDGGARRARRRRLRRSRGRRAARGGVPVPADRRAPAAAAAAAPYPSAAERPRTGCRWLARAMGFRDVEAVAREPTTVTSARSGGSTRSCSTGRCSMRSRGCRCSTLTSRRWLRRSGWRRSASPTRRRRCATSRR